MLQGTMYVTTDINVVMNCMGKCKIIRIGEADSKLDDRYVVVGSVLTPPYQALSAYLDNNIDTFLGIYEQHLNSKQCTQFISILIKALMNGHNLLLYLNNDEYDIYFGALMRHMANKYGIVIGTINNQFEFNINYSHMILAYLYDFELITVKELFELYPQGIAFPPFIIQKLVYETGVKLNNATLEDYMKYFYKIKENTKANNNVYLEPVIYRG